MPASRQLIVIGSLAVILAGAVWWAGSRDDRASLPQPEARLSGRSAEGLIPPHLSEATQASDPKASELQAGSQPGSAETSIAGEPQVSGTERGSASRRHVNGTVLSRRGKLPFEGVVVETIARTAGPNGEERWTTQATTDKAGRFTLDLPTDVWKQNVQYELEVRSNANTRPVQPLLRETRRLVEGMEVLITLEKSLHGVVTFEPARPEGDLRIELLERNQFRVGISQLGSDGVFEVDASSHALPSGGLDLPATIQLRCRGPRSEIAEAEVDVSKLASEAGAIVTLRLYEVELQVAAAGRPQNAMISAHAPGPSTGPVFHAQERVPASIRFFTSSNVIAVELSTPTSRWEAGAIRLKRGVTNIVAVELRAETGTEIVRGRVTNEHGAPARADFVRAWPVESPLAVSEASRLTRCNSDGQFELDLSADRAWTIEARAEDRLARQVWRHGSGPIELHLAQAATLVVTQAPEDCSVALIAADGSATFKDPSSLGMILGLAPGDYRAFLHSRSARLFANAQVRLAAGERTEIAFEGRPAYVGAGRVQSAAGDAAGLALLLDAPEWPESLRARWGRAWTTADGSFELFLGEHPSGRVHVLRDGVALGTFDIAATATNEVRVP